MTRFGVGASRIHVIKRTPDGDELGINRIADHYGLKPHTKIFPDLSLSYIGVQREQ